MLKQTNRQPNIEELMNSHADILFVIGIKGEIMLERGETYTTRYQQGKNNSTTYLIGMENGLMFRAVHDVADPYKGKTMKQLDFDLEDMDHFINLLPDKGLTNKLSFTMMDYILKAMKVFEEFPNE